MLLVDAAQGIEAQTLANLYLAMENDLTIIPVLNKIDLPAAQPEKYAEELAKLIGGEPEDVPAGVRQDRRGRRARCSTRSSGRSRRRPGDADAPARAMIFDSVYDTYRGVVTYVRVIDGQLDPRERIVDDVDPGHPRAARDRRHLAPSRCPAQGPRRRRGRLPHHRREGRAPVARSATRSPTPRKPATEALGGYRDPKPMVFSGLYPIDGSDYPDLREALDKLKLNDAALVYEPETSAALGFGFRCGFLGLLHLEIVRERLEREFGLDLISTAPNVVYDVTMDDGKERRRHQPERVPRRQDRRGARADRARHDPRAERVHRRDHGALPAAPRHAARHGLPLRGPRRDALHAAARRDRLRLLRPAEVAHPRLRLPRLRARRRAGGRPRQGRHPAAGRDGRRVQRDRPPATRRTPTAS